MEIGETSLKVTVQITPAVSYPLLLGQDVMRLLRMDVLTSQGKVLLFNKKEEGSYLPMYQDYNQVPEDIKT